MGKEVENFTFKEIDSEGHETLDAIAEADAFNQWMYDTIAPYCNGKILEIGSGIGNISNFFIEANKNITLSDIRKNYCDELRSKFSNTQVEQIDIADPEFDKRYAHLFNQFDSVFALNVVEHIKDHQLAIDNCRKLLKSGGHLIILVPAYQALYNSFDIALEHYRRYNKTSLNKLFGNFKIVSNFYFNFTAIFGWFITGTIMKKNTIPSDQMRLFNMLMPIIKIMDKIVMNKIGISVVTVGRKL